MSLAYRHAGGEGSKAQGSTVICQRSQRSSGLELGQKPALVLADQGSLQQPVLWAILLHMRTVLGPDTVLVGVDRDGECEVLCPVAELIGRCQSYRGSQLASEDGEGQRRPEKDVLF